MTLNELIEQLTDLRDHYEAGEVEVRAAYQQNYPLMGEVDAVTLDKNYRDGERIWIAVGSAPYAENPYAPSHAWQGDIIEDDEDE